ncbi:MAG TPA: peptidylprolyl isomerase [Gemmatimonadales bacterium]|nr:peptidylprolyl isomerase [Gemmatimonadales bacterium]
MRLPRIARLCLMLAGLGTPAGTAAAQATTSSADTAAAGAAAKDTVRADTVAAGTVGADTVVTAPGSGFNTPRPGAPRRGGFNAPEFGAGATVTEPGATFGTAAAPGSAAAPETAAVAESTAAAETTESPETPLPADSVLVVDRVVAVVGNRPVLASQVDEELFSRQAQGVKLPTDPEQLEAVRRQVVSSIVDEELLVQQAVRDTSIEVTDQEIADGVEQQVRKVRSNFSSELDYTNELKKAGFQTPEEYRRWLTDQQRRAALQNRLIDALRTAGKLKPVAPTEQEMRKFFEEQKGNLGSRPATLSFRQIVIAPKPSAAAKARTKARADSIVLELRRGADFATAARRFSQDPGSRDQGGSLNWFRRGVMVPEFERVAFALKPGVVSDPVESPYGYHIIQVERTQPAEVQARHILLIPEIDSANVDSARAMAERIHRLVSNGASFDSLQRLHHDPSGGEREADNVPADKVPETYAAAIAQADSGTVVPVFTLKGTGDREQFVVLKVTGRRSQGDIRYEDVKDRIRQQLGQELAIRRYLDQLRKTTYVEIRI